ncbi:MAG: hypothetical protein IKI08_06945 [Selenomonadaceae bacterium]|nr:hypothetical protein [Selenomonadaceae bacterium]
MENFSLLLSYIISADNLRSLLVKGEAAGLIIPEDFAKKFYTQQPIDLAFMQDGANTLQAGYAASSMQFATNAAIHLNGNRATPQALNFSFDRISRKKYI